VLRRAKPVVFEDESESEVQSDTDPSPAPSARRDLSGRPSLRKGPALATREMETFLPQRESIEEPRPNAVHERVNFLRSEFENEPITKGSQESLAALRAEFRRKHVQNDDEPGGLTLPSFSLGGIRPRASL
jgi:hypothetical protein